MYGVRFFFTTIFLASRCGMYVRIILSNALVFQCTKPACLCFFYLTFSAPLASSPVWARDFRSSEELITEFCRECRVVRKGKEVVHNEDISSCLGAFKRCYLHHLTCILL